jgi:hypothetical protein
LLCREEVELRILNTTIVNMARLTREMKANGDSPPHISPEEYTMISRLLNKHQRTIPSHNDDYGDAGPAAGGVGAGAGAAPPFDCPVEIPEEDELVGVPRTISSAAAKAANALRMQVSVRSQLTHSPHCLETIAVCNAQLCLICCCCCCARHT